MGNLDPKRLLDPRFLDEESSPERAPELFPIVTE